MALKDLETRQVARRELKSMLAEYLHGKAGRIDINAMGDYLFDRMTCVPEAGYCRRCVDVLPCLKAWDSSINAMLLVHVSERLRPWQYSCLGCLTPCFHARPRPCRI